MGAGEPALPSTTTIDPLRERLGLLDPGEPEPLYLDDDGVIPNNPLPALIYHGNVGRSADPAADFEALLRAQRWPAQWRGGVFGFHHYHSTAHEALAVFAGRARVQLGGRQGPVVAIEAGDVIILPAGVGHSRVEAADGFGVVGAYPANGPDWDLCREDPAAHDAAVARIARVPLPVADPVLGRDGPLLRLWSA